MIYLFFLILTILLEGIATGIPIVLDVLLVFFILKRRSRLLVSSFFAGIALDIFRVRTLGGTAVFFIIFILLVFLYERKFEIATYPFVFFASFLGGAVYLLVFGYDQILAQSVASSTIAALMFKGCSYFNRISSVKSQNH